MLQVENISLSFQKVILHDISFRIKEGEVIGIAGKSGAGKTSLLKIIAGLVDATAGKVTFEGKKVLGPSIKLVPGHDDIQLVNQDFGLDVYHTTEQNIREKILYLPEKQRNKFVEELLDLVELSEMRTQKANSLSGGEQQRLSIARALACEPKLLLLDEPFVHLDTRLKTKLLNYLLMLKEIRKTSIVLVSHDGSELLSLCSKLIYLKGGKIKRVSTPESAFYNYKTLEEGELYGWVNSVTLNNQRSYFRPNEYEIAPKNKGQLKIKFVSALFQGGTFLNTFRTEDGKNIVLLNSESMENTTEINVKKKNQNP